MCRRLWGHLVLVCVYFRWKISCSLLSITEAVLLYAAPVRLRCDGNFAQYTDACFHLRLSVFSDGTSQGHDDPLRYLPTCQQAQPRNIIIAMPVSALIGMGVGKLFAMQDNTRFPSEYDKQWASSSTAVALSLLVTQEFSVP